MKIVVPMNLVPDLVEELTIDDNGTTLDMTWLRLTINEFDDHAIEQAILLKENSDSHVVVLAPHGEAQGLRLHPPTPGLSHAMHEGGLVYRALIGHEVELVESRGEDRAEGPRDLIAQDRW